MFAYEHHVGAVDVAFTDRFGGASGAPVDELNLAVGSDDPRVPENIERVRAAFGSGDRWVHLRQVHGADVYRADVAAGAAPFPEADAALTTQHGVTLSIRAADCVPVLLADPDRGVIAAAHAGRAGMVRGVVGETVRAMRAAGAREIQAWIGPHICGRCYEVPEAMRAEVADDLPQAWAQTSWGTPALDLGAGVRHQLEQESVLAHEVGRCTLESDDLFSYRRDGRQAGRHAGLIRIRP